MANILLVDDDTKFLNATTELLRMLGHTVHGASSVGEAKSMAVASRYTHAILDLILPDGSGLHVLDALNAEHHNLQVALVTGHASIKSFVMNLYGPNIKYLIKPIDLEQLNAFLATSSDGSSSRESGIKKHFGHLVGESPVMQKLYEMIERVSQTQANVMLVGESGAGKEEVAASIHVASQVRGNFVPINCGAFSTELINSELFGHEKGAFTGAISRKPGVFELAQDGTLFLDEITEMPIDLQPNLLRVLESRKVIRLGGTAQLDVNCRVVSATNRPEHEIARDKKLREDLYFRLAVFPIHIPPLRTRRDDIPLLVEHFLTDLNLQYNAKIGIREEDLERLCQYDWPGNVRELRHCLHRAYIMADQATGKIRLPERIQSPFSRVETTQSNGIHFGKTVEDVERELIQTTLEHLDGDKKKAAEMLGISLKTLYNRLNSYTASNSYSE
ncbi:sigma-54-dependent Fis family transcriptional regulator [Saccharophagus sp. K07]|uniref:sigma-54-dependent transcriptional regulator n=1 Tax=Saccharophagus sp. K07 TaxID=2283636 RepID=UPI001651E103|nr:sigma-54-dependent Fis family transcriptional regulator [Saccharophagus sp. K07]